MLLPLSFPKPRRASGFTLTELAVVLVIVALLMGGLLMPLSAQQEIENRQQTGKQLNTIREALIAFATINARLPCPDGNNDGQEETTCSIDGAQDGQLPWRTLAIPASDAWGNPWRYRIERQYATYATLRGLILKDGDDCIGATSAFPDDCIDVQNNLNQRLNSNREHPVAIVYSTGPNQQPDGQNASYETGRLHSPNYQTDVPSPNFDDQLIWLTRGNLIAPLIAAGKLP
jgi:prepilin-type N-terminal cleavage/methylation domain-containing protein